MKSPLDALHKRLGARMVPFAGYDMPVQYEGIMAEHQACRNSAALFDVSHMGQAELTDAAAFEKLVPGDIVGLKPGRQRYTLLLNGQGGIIDDLMVLKLGDRLQLVLNASRKAIDLAHLAEHGVEFIALPDRALLALQGPKAAEMLPEAAYLNFMGGAEITIAGIACIVSRSGYTGEDGFEIGCAGELGIKLAEELLGRGAVPAGLGARDSLRLEAGLCLYGNDIDEHTNPIAANLGFAIGKRRKIAWDFLGADAVRTALENGTDKKLVGIRVEGRAPARAETVILAPGGQPIGSVTSGTFGATVGGPVALGYVATEFAAPDTRLGLLVREKIIPGIVSSLPFIPHRYVR